MNVLFITSLLGGKEYSGAEVSTRLLLESLKAHGQTVEALTTRKNPKDKSLISISLPIEVPKKLVTLGNNQIDYFLARKIKNQLQIIQPDVIHVQDTYILPAAVAANCDLKIPSVATIRNSVLDETWHMMFPRPISTMLCWRNKTIVKALHHIDCVISVSEYIKTELVRRGIESKKVTPIYNLPPVFKISKKPSSSQKESVVHLFALGQLETFKGFSTLIKAMKIVVQSNPDVDLVIAGDGSQRQRLENLTRKLQLELNVKFAGKIPFTELAHHYVDCDIVVFPSIYAEPFGRVALEAMYFSKPVVASRAGGIPEVVADKTTGILVSPADPMELAEAILTLVKDSKLRVFMGEKGKSSIEKRFSSYTILEEHLKVYETALKVRVAHYRI